MAVRLVIVVRSLEDGWTLRSVAYSLQDGCLASICTSDNEDSERNLWGLTAGSCRNGALVCHVSQDVSWLCEARVADRLDPCLILTNTHTFLLWQSETGRYHLGALSRTLRHACHSNAITHIFNQIDLYTSNVYRSATPTFTYNSSIKFYPSDNLITRTTWPSRE